MKPKPKALWDDADRAAELAREADERAKLAAEVAAFHAAGLVKIAPPFGGGGGGKSGDEVRNMLSGWVETEIT